MPGDPKPIVIVGGNFVDDASLSFATSCFLFPRTSSHHSSLPLFMSLPFLLDLVRLVLPYREEAIKSCPPSLSSEETEPLRSVHSYRSSASSLPVRAQRSTLPSLKTSPIIVLPLLFTCILDKLVRHVLSILVKYVTYFSTFHHVVS